MTLNEEIKELLSQKRTIDQVKAAFKLHNEHFTPKETNMHCGRCVQKVFKRLQIHLDLNNGSA